MRIAVDARPLRDEKSGGISTFLRNTLTALGQMDRENEYVLYAHRPLSWTGPEGMRVRARCGRRGFGSVWLQSVAPLWIRRDGIDLFWGTQHLLPLAAPRALPMVLTVHDLVYRRFPETMRFFNRWSCRCLAGPSARRADLVAADSRATAADLALFSGVGPEKTRVVPLGVEERFRPMDRAEARRIVAARAGDDRPFVLSVGTLEPRKNLALALRAFARVPDRLPHAFFLAGPSGWKMADVFPPGALTRTLEKRVRRLGFWPQELLPTLYAAADAFLFPSLYEGFGLPVLEAMACGTPVITSSVSSLPEVAGDAAVLVDPSDEAALAARLEELLSDAGRREDLSRLGLARAKTFPWTATARRMLDLFREAVG